MSNFVYEIMDVHYNCDNHFISQIIIMYTLNLYSAVISQYKWKIIRVCVCVCVCVGKLKGWEKLYHANINQAGVVVLMSDKANFGTKNFQRPRRSLYNNKRTNPPRRQQC